MKLYGFNCEEYRVNKEIEFVAIWASSENSELAKEIDRISGIFDELFQTEENEDIDEWQLITGTIPVQVKTYRSAMEAEESGITIQTITNIDKHKPSADNFRVPGEDEGFTKGSMMEMMMQMMPGDE